MILMAHDPWTWEPGDAIEVHREDDTTPSHCHLSKGELNKSCVHVSDGSDKDDYISTPHIWQLQHNACSPERDRPSQNDCQWRISPLNVGTSSLGSLTPFNSGDKTASGVHLGLYNHLLTFRKCQIFSCQVYDKIRTLTNFDLSY